VISRMLSLNPKDRISVDHLLEHPFVKEQPERKDFKVIDCVVVE